LEAGTDTKVCKEITGQFPFNIYQSKFSSVYDTVLQMIFYHLWKMTKVHM